MGPSNDKGARNKEGKVRAIGLSNFTVEQIKEILAVCDIKPAILQTEVHPYSQEKELKAFLAKEGIVIPGFRDPDHIRANADLFDFALTDGEMAAIELMNKDKRYYHSTPEMLAGYASMVPPVDEQK